MPRKGILGAILILVTVFFGGLASQTEGATEKAYGGTMVAALPYDLKVLNMNYEYDPLSYFVLGSIMSRLVTYDWNFDPIPDLAERWDISADGLTYTFSLARNAKWHDGTPATAHDVKWTIESVIAEKGVAAKYLEDIKEVLTPDDHTVKIRLNKANSSFLMNLATYYGFAILPKHIFAETDVRKNPANWKPIGTGPFKFVEHVRGSHITVAANPDYFKGRPYLDRIVFKVITSRPVIFAAVKTGEIHLSLAAAPFPEIPQLRATPGVKVALPPPNRPQTLHFNLRRAPFNDLRVRRAIAHVIDRREISEKVFSGMLKPADGAYVPSHVWFYNPNAKQLEYNPTAAEKLLDEAGLKRGSDGVRFKTRYAGFIALTFGSREIGEVLKEQLKKVGIDLTLEMREFALFKEVIRERHDFDLAWSAGEMGPDPSVYYNFIGSKGFRNVMGYNNPTVDDLFEKALRAVTVEDRKKIYGEIQRIVNEDLPQINLVEYTDPWAHRADFHGFPWEEVGKGRLNRDDYSLVWWEGARRR